MSYCISEIGSRSYSYHGMKARLPTLGSRLSTTCLDAEVVSELKSLSAVLALSCIVMAFHSVVLLDHCDGRRFQSLLFEAWS